MEGSAGAPRDLSTLRIPESKRRRRGLPGKGLLLLLLAAAGAWFSRALWLPRVETALATEVTLATVEEVTPAGALASNLTANGYVVAQRRAALAPKVSGKLEELLVVEGSRVGKDEVIARLEHRDLDAQIARARAQTEEAEGEVRRAQAAVEENGEAREEAADLEAAAAAALDESEASLADAVREFERESRLRADGVGTAADHDRARAAKEVAEARVAQARARVDSAARRSAALAAEGRQLAEALNVAGARVRAREAEAALLDVQLEYLTIRAPFAGVVVEKNAEVGEIVAPISGAAQSNVAVVTLVDMESLMVEADVSEAQIRRVRPDGPARITLDADPDRILSGRVFKVVPTADRQKATVKVKIAFDRIEEGIVPEMAARVFFLEEAEKAAETRRRLFVPAAALRGSEGAPFVWVFVDGAVRRREVAVGGRADSRVEITGGLAAGERVVVEAAGELSEGRAARERR